MTKINNKTSDNGGVKKKKIIYRISYWLIRGLKNTYLFSHLVLLGRMTAALMTQNSLPSYWHMSNQFCSMDQDDFGQCSEELFPEQSQDKFLTFDSVSETIRTTSKLNTIQNNAFAISITSKPKTESRKFFFPPPYAVLLRLFSAGRHFFLTFLVRLRSESY